MPNEVANRSSSVAARRTFIKSGVLLAGTMTAFHGSARAQPLEGDTEQNNRLRANYHSPSQSEFTCKDCRHFDSETQCLKYKFTVELKAGCDFGAFRDARGIVERKMQFLRRDSRYDLNQASSCLNCLNNNDSSCSASRVLFQNYGQQETLPVSEHTTCTSLRSPIDIRQEFDSFFTYQEQAAEPGKCASCINYASNDQACAEIKRYASGYARETNTIVSPGARCEAHTGRMNWLTSRAEASKLAGGWWQSPVLGAFWTRDFAWVYSVSEGTWLFIQPDASNPALMWAYSSKDGWYRLNEAPAG